MSSISTTTNPLVFFPGETAWHRDWKESFPNSYREVTFRDQQLGHFHRADIQTPCGTTIEFQNSPICLEELRSREQFYPNLIWVVNGKKFKGFKTLKHLPDMNDLRLTDFEFCHRANLTMVRKSEIIKGIEKPKVLTFHHPELRSIPLTSYNYSFRWRFPHKVWYEAKCPLIFDFGGHFLYQLEQREQLIGSYAYLRMITRGSFIERYWSQGVKESESPKVRKSESPKVGKNLWNHPLGEKSGNPRVETDL